MVLGYPPEDVRQFIINHRPPPYDAEVEYLESTGTQYIRTGILGSQIINGGMEIDSMHLADESYFPVACGILPIDNFCMNGWHESPKDLYWRFNTQRKRCRPNGFPVVPETFFNARIKSVAKNGTVSVSCNGVDATQMYDGGFSYGQLCANNSNLLCLFSYDNCQRSSVMRLFGAKVWNENSQLMLNFIPVRFTNEQGQSEGAMYNRLGVGGMNPDGSPRNDGLYRNQGTGSFAFGDDV